MVDEMFQCHLRGSRVGTVGGGSWVDARVDVEINRYEDE